MCGYQLVKKFEFSISQKQCGWVSDMIWKFYTYRIFNIDSIPYPHFISSLLRIFSDKYDIASTYQHRFVAHCIYSSACQWKCVFSSQPTFAWPKKERIHKFYHLIQADQVFKRKKKSGCKLMFISFRKFWRKEENLGNRKS